MNGIFIKKSNIVLLIYDITNKESFDELDYFYNDVDKNVGKDNVIFGVIANKTDLNKEQIITSEEGKEYAKKINALYFETSAKDYKSIENAFKEIVKLYYKNLDTI